MRIIMKSASTERETFRAFFESEIKEITKLLKNSPDDKSERVPTGRGMSTMFTVEVPSSVS